MKTLTNEEVIYLLERCGAEQNKCIPNCPLWKECLHYFMGEDTGSCLEEKE